jgi:hypothetical protein
MLGEGVNRISDDEVIDDAHVERCQDFFDVAGNGLIGSARL